MPALLAKKVVGEQPRRHVGVLNGPVKLVCSDFREMLVTPPLGLAENWRQTSPYGTLNPVQDQRAGRRSRLLARIRGRRGPPRVDGDVRPVRPGAIHRVADDLGRLKRPVQTGIAGEGGTPAASRSGSTDCMGDREFLQRASVHHGTQGGSLGRKQRGFVGNRDALLRRTDFQPDVHRQPSPTRTSTSSRRNRLNAGNLYFHLVHSGDQVTWQ